MTWKGAVLIDADIHELLMMYAMAMEISEAEAARTLVAEGAVTMRQALHDRLKQAPSAPGKADQKQRNGGCKP